jgi:hypothetical protein
MSEISARELASIVKWILVIIVASIAYGKYAPNYHFMQRGGHIYRAHTVTGAVEYLEDNAWVNTTESAFSRIMRKDRQKRRAEEGEKLAMETLQEESEDSDVPDFIGILEDYESKGRGT